MQALLGKQYNCHQITLNVWPGNEAALKFYEKMGMKTRSIVMEDILDNKQWSRLFLMNIVFLFYAHQIEKSFKINYDFVSLLLDNNR